MTIYSTSSPHCLIFKSMSFRWIKWSILIWLIMNFIVTILNRKTKKNKFSTTVKCMNDLKNYLPSIYHIQSINEYKINHLRYGGILLYQLGWILPLQLAPVLLSGGFLLLPLQNLKEDHSSWRHTLARIEEYFLSSLQCGLLSRDFHRDRASILHFWPRSCFCSIWQGSPDS